MKLVSCKTLPGIRTKRSALQALDETLMLVLQSCIKKSPDIYPWRKFCETFKNNFLRNTSGRLRLFIISLCRTEYLKNSFFSACHEWLDRTQTQNLRFYLSKFSKYLINKISERTLQNPCHCQVGIKLLTRLQLGFSHLNLISANHFSLCCHFYNQFCNVIQINHSSDLLNIDSSLPSKGEE